MDMCRWIGLILICGTLCGVSYIGIVTVPQEHSVYYGSFQQTQMTIISLDTGAYKCCQTDNCKNINGLGIPISQCTDASAGIQTCDSNLVTNTPGECDGGYYCCQQHGSTCVKSTSHQKCEISCQMCYKPSVTVNFILSDGKSFNATETYGTCDQFTGFTAELCLESSISGYNVGDTIFGYYLISNPTYIHLHEGILYNMSVSLKAGFSILTIIGVIALYMLCIPRKDDCKCKCRHHNTNYPPNKQIEVIGDITHQHHQIISIS